MVQGFKRVALPLAVLVVVGCNDSERLYGDPASGGTAGTGGGGGSTSAGAAGGSGGSSGGAGTGNGNSAGEDSSGGEAGGPPAPDPGEPCTEESAIQCAGTNQRERIECKEGFWKAYAECEEDERCDTGASDGACQPVVQACADKEPGEGVCVGLERSDCGPDLVTLENTENCDLFCVEHEGKSECSACEAEQYSTDGTPEGCTPWSTCSAGEYVTEPGSADTNRECDDCDEAFSTTENAESCTEWKTCTAGQVVTKNGTKLADRECATCDGGYTTSDNAASCTPWTTCTWAQGGVAQAGKPDSNAVCGTPSAYRQFGSSDWDGALATAADGSGNVYVAGYTNGDLEGNNPGASAAFVRKYDKNGSVVWTRQFANTSNGNITRVTSVAPDSNGNVYVAGYTGALLEGTHFGSDDAFVRKYDSNGNVLWTRQFGTDWTDQAHGVAVDGSGYAYVVGQTGSALTGTSFGSTDAFMRKFDTDGDELWTKQWGSSSFDVAYAVAAIGTGTGTVYVAGDVGNGELRTFALNGTAGWVRAISSTVSSTAYSLAVQGSGEAFVAGYTSGNLVGTNAGSMDVFIRKFAANGDTAWTKQFGTPNWEQGDAVAVDGNGNSYVTGYTLGAIAGTNAGGSDVFLRKYDPSGNAISTQQFGTTSNDHAEGMTVDGEGNLFIAGDTDGAFVGTQAGSGDVYLRRIAP